MDNIKEHGKNMILETNYQAFDEDMGESFEILLVDIKAYELISINITMLCLYVIYVTYQISCNKVKDIYIYFKNNPNFRNISIEDSFKLVVEKLIDLDGFYLEWISFLSETINKIDQKTYYLLQFFTGNFEIFYNESINRKKSRKYPFSSRLYCGFCDNINL